MCKQPFTRLGEKIRSAPAEYDALLGTNWKFEPIEGRERARMYVDRAATDLRNDATWPDLYRWFGENLEVLYNEVAPKLRQELDQNRHVAVDNLMPNRNLSPAELQNTNVLLAEIRERLRALASGDAALLFAYRRKIVKELDTTSAASRWCAAGSRPEAAHPDGICPLCTEKLPDKYAVLDRRNARLICEACDRDVQTQRGFR